MKKLLIVLFSLFLFSFTFSNEKENPLVVGMELAYPPFETTDANGDPAGFSVDFAKALGEYLGRPVKIENMAFKGLIPALLSKKVDIVISSMTITEERLKAVNFSKPYAKAYLTLLVNNKSNINIPEDLNASGKKIAVKAGTTAHLTATQYFPKAETLVFDKETAAVLEVSQGKVDAFIYDPLSIYRNWKNYRDTTKPIFTQFQKEVEGWGVAYRKQDVELGKEIDAFIDKFRAEGGFNRLVEKHLAEEKKVFDQQGIPFFIQ